LGFATNIEMRKSRFSREAIRSAILIDIQHWLFTSRLRVPVDAAQEGRATQDGMEELVLSTMLRELAHGSSYDRLVPPHSEAGGASLHFLDPEAATVQSYCGLRNTHGPQMFAGQPIESPLAEMRLSRTSGELVHPGEYERLTGLREALAKAKQEAEARAQREAEEAARTAYVLPPSLATRGGPPTRPAPAEEAAAPAIYGGKKLTCLFCGTLTEDCWAKEGDGVHCRCRTCYRAGKA